MINNFFFLVAILFVRFHDCHVTHTTFHYSDESKSMEITIKVAIEEKLILEYFRNNLTLSPDKNTKVYQWVGKELSDNLHDIYLYFEIPNYDKNENVESITIKNTLFLDLYDYQTNIVLIELIDRKYNLTFTIDNDIQTILMNKVR